MESCVFKTGVSGVVGFGFGGLLSLFMQAGVWQNTDEMMKLKLKDQIKATYRDMKKRTMETGKNLAVVGAVFAGTECVIESYRGKNDIYNGVAAGCITGGALAAQAGPQAVVAGCVGFAGMLHKPPVRSFL